MNVSVNQNDVERALEAQFDSLADSHKELPTILAEARREAVADFGRSGLPHRRVETWKYTDLRKLMRTAFAPGDQAAAAKANVTPDGAIFAGLPGVKLVFANGFFREDLSNADQLPEGVTLEPLKEAFTRDPELLLATGKTSGGGKENAIGDLVAALCDDGFVLRVGDGVETGEPVHLVYLNNAPEPFAAYHHVLVSLGSGASLTLLESHTGSGAYQVSGALGFELGDNAVLDHVKHQGEAPQAQHLARMVVRLADNSSLRSFTLNNGANLSRNETHVVARGSNSFVQLSGAGLLKNKQHGDTTIVMDHAVPDCNSEQTFKFVMDDEATGVFQGKVIVRPGAHGTDGRQSSNALLLSERAAMNAKPELEIYNDDVQCAHGSTIGELDEDLMFYLRARGIPEGPARALLIQAFIGGAVEMIRDEAIRETISGAVETWLEEVAG